MSRFRWNGKLYRRMGLSLVLLSLQWALLQDHGLVKAYQLYRARADALALRDSYAERNLVLQAKRDYLYRGETAVAYYARKSLGWVRPGECLVFFSEKETPKP